MVYYRYKMLCRVTEEFEEMVDFERFLEEAMEYREFLDAVFYDYQIVEGNAEMSAQWGIRTEGLTCILADMVLPEYGFTLYRHFAQILLRPNKVLFSQYPEPVKKILFFNNMELEAKNKLSYSGAVLYENMRKRLLPPSETCRDDTWDRYLVRCDFLQPFAYDIQGNKDVELFLRKLIGYDETFVCVIHRVYFKKSGGVFVVLDCGEKSVPGIEANIRRLFKPNEVTIEQMDPLSEYGVLMFPLMEIEESKLIWNKIIRLDRLQNAIYCTKRIDESRRLIRMEQINIAEHHGLLGKRAREESQKKIDTEKERISSEESDYRIWLKEWSGPVRETADLEKEMSDTSYEVGMFLYKKKDYLLASRYLKDSKKEEALSMIRKEKNLRDFLHFMDKYKV